MRLTAVLLIATALHVSATGYSQKISLSVKDAPVEQVFNQIKQQTGLAFIWDESTLQQTHPVTLDIKNATLEEALNACLKDQPLIYVIKNGLVEIKQKIAIQNPAKESTDQPPPGEIHGTITNAQGVPLSGANVIIKRTKTGTQTNVKGEFKLTVNPDDILIISFIGYKTQTVKVGGGKDFPVVMEIAKNELDRVEVKAYGETSQRLTTGNIAVVTAAEIERQPVMNPLQALDGQVAGLNIIQTTGYASSPFKVEIRGRNTIDPNATSDPLYIIDGVPLTVLNVSGVSSYANGSTGFIQGNIYGPAAGQNPLFSINPSDIESVSVLKDADATSIYGSRAANGVIIITTKKGKAEKAKFDMSVYQGIEKVTRYFSLLNTNQYLSMRKEAFRNDGLTPDAGSAYDLIIWDSTRNTDWQKYLWGGTGKTTDVQLSLSGGDKQNTFRLGAGYHRETDINTVSGENQRGNLQFNLSHNSLDQKLNISFTTVYTIASVDIVDVSALVSLPPNAPPAFDSKGNLNYRGWDPIAYSFPFANLKSPYTATTNFLNSNLGLKYEILKGLNFTTNFGYSLATVVQSRINPIASQDPLNNPTGTSDFGYNNNTNWIIEPQLNYKKLIGRSKINILIGGSVQNVTTNGNNLHGEGYTNDNLLGSVSNAPITTGSDFYGRYKYASLFSQLTYNWEDKYILNLSARRDGSSRFGPGKQFGNFGALGAAWIFTQESWFKDNISFISFGKLRGSYGTTGNDQIGDYKYLTRWSGTGVIPYQGYESYIPIQHNNPDYHWEVNKKLEVALDLSFIRDRINFEIAWYQNRCDNQLVLYPLPIQTGFPYVTANSPANVQNTGLELLISGNIIESKSFKWNIRFNIYTNQNKLLAFPNLAQSPYANQIFIGKPLNITSLLHYTGVDPQTGQYTYQDKNKDGFINAGTGQGSDLFIYNLNPQFAGGLGSNFGYKGWALDLFFRFKKQIGRNAYYSGGVPGGPSNQAVQVLDRWTQPGQSPAFARFTTQPSAADANFVGSDGILTDASFIRLGNLSLSYNLSDRILNNSGIKSLQIYFHGENLLTITDFKGIDPENQGFASMPYSKILTLGLKFTF